MNVKYTLGNWVVAYREGCMLQHRGGEGVAAVKRPFSYVDVNWENVGTFPVDVL